MTTPDSQPSDIEDEPWVFVIEGKLNGEWDADGSWMMLEGIESPEEVEALKRYAIEAARKRRAAIRDDTAKD